MAFLLNVLHPGDVFVDFGANVGSYTILASGVALARILSPRTYPRQSRVPWSGVTREDQPRRSRG
jgi:hypothetical protein